MHSLIILILIIHLYITKLSLKMILQSYNKQRSDVCKALIFYCPGKKSQTKTAQVIVVFSCAYFFNTERNSVLRKRFERKYLVVVIFKAKYSNKCKLLFSEYINILQEEG